MTVFAAGAATHVGQVRTINQDNTLIGDGVFAVADGMGGHRGGEVASAVAVEALVANFRSASTASLFEAVKDANKAVVERAAGDPELRGMGTTLCALASVRDPELGDVLSIVNVGDSRAYLLKSGTDELEQISEDHSLVQQLVRQGQLDPSDAANHPQRNIVTRALGIDPDVKPDVFVLLPVQGDRYLLCSDGLFNEVDEATIARVLRERTDPDEAVHELVRLANEGGGRDNISVVVVDIVEDDGEHRVAADEASDEHRVVEVRRGGDRPLDSDTQQTQAVAASVGGDASRAEGAASTPSTPSASAGASAALDPSGDGAATRSGGVAVDASARPSGVVVDRPAVVADDPAVLVPPALTPVVRRKSRLTWRVLLFIAALAAIVASAVYAVNWVSTNTYYVALDQGTVTIFQGRPGGLLWNQPKAVASCELTIDQVSSEFRDDVTKGRDEPSLDAAQQYCANLTPATTTTTTTSTTTSTAVDAGNGVPGFTSNGADAPTP